ncbi:MAG TPA: prepilin-type N-terminal cleavage/methylation domain-containing protein [Candidatus Dormibacteraeota bacterium]|jgi:Tfp pilus assembly protein PilW|nr:prepilin-type N-terminal cleavage/methylation domain-containing protein [Candidatus Dormibacteraeota bacterium]
MNTQKKIKQAGFSLIELLVSIGVTTVILGATLLAFKDAANTQRGVSYSADMNDNLRAGLNLIQQDLILAGTGIPTGGIPIPNTPNSANTCNTTLPPNRPTLTGSLTFPVCNFVLPAIEPGSALGPLITAPDATSGNPSNPNSFTDVITVLYADNALALDNDAVNSTACPGGSITASGNSVTFDSSVNCQPLGTGANAVTINAGDLIMFSNAKGNAIQTVTSVSGQTVNFASGDAFNLNGRTDPQGTIKQLQNTDTSGNPNGTYPPTTATRIWMISYYLDNITDPQHVRLVRRVNFDPTPLAQLAVGETLENMQFTYNYVDGVTNPSNQVGVPSGLSENQIRSVNVFLGARSNYYDQQRKRYTRVNLSTQISLRSMAYRNRYN